MAYQPKSYRKFVATAATATLVASAVAPAALAASFTDVADKYKEAVDYLVTNKISQGATETTFGTSANIKRGDAAIWLANALKLDLTNVPASGFSDTGRYDAAVSALKAKGVLSGKTETTYQPNALLTRGEMAKILANAYNLKSDAQTPFTDLGPNFGAHIAALYANKITEGKTETTFGTSENITRGDLAIFLMRAATLNATPVVDVKAISAAKVVDKNTIEVTFDAALKAEDVKASDFAIEGVEIESATIKAAAAATTQTVVVIKTKTELKVDGKYEIKYKGASSDKTKVEYKVDAPVVTASKALNNIQVELTFNTALDKETVVKANFADNSATIDVDSVELVDSNKVVVTFNAAFANQTSVKLTLNGLKGTNGVAIAKDTTATVTFFDVTVPTVTKVTSAGPDTFKVTFSEPVSTTAASVVANYSVNNGQYFIQSAERTSLNEVTVKLYSTLADGEYDVTVKNVTDLAGFKVADTTLKLTQVADKAAPEVASVVSASPEKVVLEFTEDITLNDTSANLVAGDKVYHTNTNNTPDTIAVDPNNSKRLVLTFTTNKLPQGGTAYLVIEKDVVKDGWANKNAKYTNNITVVVDTVKPTVKKLESANDTSFKLTFSEDVQQTSAETVANYTVLDSTGKKVTTAINSAVRNTTTNSVVTLTLASSLPGGTYTVVVENVKDIAGNVIDKASTNVEVKDSTAPTVTAAGTLYAGKKIFKVAFSEPMATTGAGSVLDLANYKFGGDYLNKVEGVTVTVTDSGKAVLVDYSKSNLTVANGNTVTVGKVSDAVGNFTTSFTSVVTLTDATTVSISKAEATGTKTVKVTLDDSLTKFNAADFVLKQNGVATTPASVTFANVDGKGVITYTLTTALNTDATTAVTVETAASTSSENAFGVKVGASLSAVTAADKIAPVLAKFDHDSNAATDTVENIRLSFTDKSTTGNTAGKVDRDEEATITLTYSEAMKANSFSTQSFKVNGFTVTDVSVTGTSVVLTVTADANNTGVSPTIEQIADVQDANSVVLVKGGSWTVR
jgi:trimeric autotransporter adhesin